MVHEHHSPVTVLPSTGAKPMHILSEFDPSSASKAQLDVLETFMAIRATILENSGDGPGSMDELISFHGYGRKFTEFNDGHSFDSKGNEHNERQLFGEDLEEWDEEVNQFALIDGTMKIAVYNGNVANVTFISNFKLTHKTHGLITVNNLITLLFVKTKGKWKIVHEHHSPAIL